MQSGEKMRILSNNFYPFILSILLSNCSVPSAPSFSSNPRKDLTRGIFENEIRKGMSQAEILETLGAPNILTKNSKESAKKPIGTVICGIHKGTLNSLTETTPKIYDKLISLHP